LNHRVSEWNDYELFKLTPQAHLGVVVTFFFCDVLKVLMFTPIVFIVAFLQTLVSPAKVRNALARRAPGHRQSPELGKSPR
jgi:uncharacterized membrane protein YraQ (UPF0718 family)